MSAGRRLARRFVALLVLPALAGLLWMEDLLERTPVRRQDATALSSPVDRLVYTPDNRETNLRTLGLDAKLFELGVAEARRMDAGKDKIVAALAEAPQGLVATAFCRQSLPVAYRAALLLMAGPRDGTTVLDPTQQPLAAAWASYPKESVTALATRYEGAPDRQPEDTAMALSALITGRAEEAIPGGLRVPFDRRYAEGGRFAGVKSVAPAVDAALLRYVARTVVMAEIVQSDPKRWGCGE